VKHFTIHSTQMVWNARYKEEMYNGYQAIGMLPGFDENFDYKHPENDGLYEMFFLSGEVLHDGIAECQKMFPDPSLRIIAREDWDKKAADSPNAKAPPQAKQSKKKRQTKPSKVVATKRKSRSTSPVPKGRGTVGLARQWVMIVLTNQAETKPQSAWSAPFGFIQKRVVPLPSGTLLFAKFAGTRMSQKLQAMTAWKSPHLASTKHTRSPSTAPPPMTPAQWARWRRMKPPWLTLTMKTVHPKEGASVPEGHALPVLA